LTHYGRSASPRFDLRLGVPVGGHEDGAPSGGVTRARDRGGRVGQGHKLQHCVRQGNLRSCYTHRRLMFAQVGFVKNAVSAPSPPRSAWASSQRATPSYRSAAWSASAVSICRDLGVAAATRSPGARLGDALLGGPRRQVMDLRGQRPHRGETRCLLGCFRQRRVIDQDEPLCVRENPPPSSNGALQP